MDPLAHTLVGAGLAQTGLRRWSSLATPALVIGANAPDIDVVSMLVSGDVALGFRRGWTHGVLALGLLPVLLWGGLVGAGAWLRRSRPDLPPPAPGRLLVLCALGVWTHPLLDWLNTYGIRLLMPWDGRWFYGDALFIVDPWVWLLGAAAVVPGRCRSAGSRLVWALLAALTSLLVLGSGIVPMTARVVWCVGVAGVLALTLWRRRGRDEPSRLASRAPAAALGVLSLYAALMVAGSRLAEARARTWLAERGIEARDIMAGPVPANPLVREIVAADATGYHLLWLDWLASPDLRALAPPVPRGPDGPVVAAAKRADQVWGLVTWMRFPTYSVERTSDGYRVELRDARHRGGRGGIGLATVDLDDGLQVRHVEDASAEAP